MLLDGFLLQALRAAEKANIAIEATFVEVFELDIATELGQMICECFPHLPGGVCPLCLGLELFKAFEHRWFFGCCDRGRILYFNAEYLLYFSCQFILRRLSPLDFISIFREMRLKVLRVVFILAVDIPDLFVYLLTI